MKLNSRNTAISTEEDLKRYLNEHDQRTDHIKELVQAQKRFTSNNDASPPISTQNSPHFIQKHPLDSSPKIFNSSLNNYELRAQLSKSPLATSNQHNESNIETRPNIQDIHYGLSDYSPSIKVSNLPSNQEKSENFNHLSPKTLEKVFN